MLCARSASASSLIIAAELDVRFWVKRGHEASVLLGANEEHSTMLLLASLEKLRTIRSALEMTHQVDQTRLVVESLPVAHYEA